MHNIPNANIHDTNTQILDTSIPTPKSPSLTGLPHSIEISHQEHPLPIPNLPPPPTPSARKLLRPSREIQRIPLRLRPQRKHLWAPTPIRERKLALTIRGPNPRGQRTLHDQRQRIIRFVLGDAGFPAVEDDG